ncbi:LCP family protein [Neobacillus sp. NRS-1170]|uniref:LCP family protein n=1 Tax=Neobacillus sp. NRS-1170 TaxID=3233898 RepID=UPI003D28F733
MERTRKKRKRVKWGRVFGALLLLGILAAGIFQVFQYIEGTMQVMNQPLQKKEEKPSIQAEKKNLSSINVLLLGSDSRGEDHARTDTIMVAHYDPQTHKMKLISLMRDMLVTIPEHGQQKLNAAYAFGGPELLSETIKENLGLEIQYYAMVDFKGFEKAVDLLVPDGIEVDVPHEMSDGIGMTLKEGKQTLHGKELLGYVRFRHDSLSDFGRIQRQQEVVSKLTEQAVGLHSILKLPELIGLLNKYIDTNIDSSTLLSMGKDLFTKKGRNIETLRIPEEGSFQNKTIDDLGEVLDVDFQQNIEALTKFLEVDNSVVSQ